MNKTNYGAKLLSVDRYAAWSVSRVRVQQFRFEHLARFHRDELLWCVRRAPHLVMREAQRYQFCRSKALRLAEAVRVIRARRKAAGVKPGRRW